MMRRRLRNPGLGSIARWGIAAALIVACMSACAPTKVAARDLVGTWLSTDHGVDSRFELNATGSAEISNVPLRFGGEFSGLGAWNLLRSGEELWLFDRIGTQVASVLVVDGISGISLLIYVCDPDQPECQFIYRRQ